MGGYADGQGRGRPHPKGLNGHEKFGILLSVRELSMSFHQGVLYPT